MRSKECASLTVAEFSGRKSTQKCNLPSLFHNITTGEAQGLLEGLIMPLSSICCIVWLPLTALSGSVDGKGAAKAAHVLTVCSSTGGLPYVIIISNKNI